MMSPDQLSAAPNPQPSGPQAAPDPVDQIATQQAAQATAAVTPKAPDEPLSEETPAPPTTKESGEELELHYPYPSSTFYHTALAGQPTIAQTDIADHTKELMDEVQNTADDTNNGHITPTSLKSLYAQKDPWAKMATIFGLLVGGAGAGIAGKDNPVLQAMQQQVTNELEAQKATATNKQNMYSLIGQRHLAEANRQSMNAETKIKTDALTHMILNRQGFDHLMETAQSKTKAGTPEQQNALQQLSMMYGSMNDMNSSIANRAAAALALTKYGQAPSVSSEQDFQQRMQGLRMSGDPAKRQIADDMESRHYTGLEGQATHPLSADNTQKITDGIQFQQALQRFMDFTKTHSGEISGTPAENTGKTLAALLSAKYREASNGGVYKAGEQSFINKIIDPDPTAFFNAYRVMPKLKAIQDESNAQINTYIRTLGFPGQAITSQTDNPQVAAKPSADLQKHIAYARANPKDPRSAKLLKSQGIQ
jgi:hypothetical protein